MEDYNMKASFGMGKESPHNSPPQSAKAPEPVGKKQLKNWFCGFLISLIPILIWPAYRLCFEGATVDDFFMTIISSCELVFVGVTLSITALNDSLGFGMSSEDSKVMPNLFLILLGAVAYGFMIIGYEKSGNVNTSMISRFNFIYLVIILVLNASVYIRQILEEK